jgi:hypothetical protein
LSGGKKPEEMIFFTIGVSALVTIVSFALLFGMKTRRPESNEELYAWLDTFNLQAYAPLDYLLNSGSESEIERSMRQDRRAIAHQYLVCLTGDFRRLLRLAKLMIVYRQEDTSSQALSLWQTQVKFYCSVAAAQLRLSCYPIVRQWSSSPVLSKLASLYDDVRPAPVS